jgi:hypothetical protein
VRIQGYYGDGYPVKNKLIEQRAADRLKQFVNVAVNTYTLPSGEIQRLYGHIKPRQKDFSDQYYDNFEQKIVRKQRVDL